MSFVHMALIAGHPLCTFVLTAEIQKNMLDDSKRYRKEFCFRPFRPIKYEPHEIAEDEA